MTHGIDTDFLVAVEVREHPFHPQAGVRRLLSNNDRDYQVFGCFEVVAFR